MNSFRFRLNRNNGFYNVMKSQRFTNEVITETMKPTIIVRILFTVSILNVHAVFCGRPLSKSQLVMPVYSQINFIPTGVRRNEELSSKQQSQFEAG